jgi:uncharacterized protein YndB with AHSA1/START domain
MNEAHGQFTARGEVRFVRLLPGTVERVWAFLTESEKRSRWLASGTMDLRVGGGVKLIFNHANITPHTEPVPEKYRDAACGHPMTGRITRCEPPRVLAYTWGEADGSDSEVTFELTPESGGATRLVLTHRRLGDNRDMILSVSAGWHAHVAILIAWLANAPVPPFWSVHAKLEADYARLLDAAKSSPASL